MNSFSEHHQVDDFSASDEGIFLAERSEISSLYVKPAPTKSMELAITLNKGLAF